jgi:hypothetical protein
LMYARRFHVTGGGSHLSRGGIILTRPIAKLNRCY